MHNIKKFIYSDENYSRIKYSIQERLLNYNGTLGVLCAKYYELHRDDPFFVFNDVCNGFDMDHGELLNASVSMDLFSKHLEKLLIKPNVYSIIYNSNFILGDPCVDLYEYPIFIDNKELYHFIPNNSMYKDIREMLDNCYCGYGFCGIVFQTNKQMPKRFEIVADEVFREWIENSLEMFFECCDDETFLLIYNKKNHKQSDVNLLI